MVVHVRPITNEEGNRLVSIVRRGKDPIEVRRAQVVLSSAQGAESATCSTSGSSNCLDLKNDATDLRALSMMSLGVMP